MNRLESLLRKPISFIWHATVVLETGVPDTCKSFASRGTDKNEFWSLIDLSDKSLDLNALAIEWQNFYNKKRPHSSLKGKTPYQKLKQVEKLIPIQPDVTKKFWESEEKVIPRNYLN